MTQGERLTIYFPGIIRDTGLVPDDLILMNHT